jgi:hypothetical protein
VKMDDGEEIKPGEFLAGIRAVIGRGAGGK